MYCLNCGRENPDDVKFCCFCGAKSNAPKNLGEIEKIFGENGQLEFDDAPDALSSENSVSPTKPVPPVSPTAPVGAVNPIQSATFAVPQPQPISAQGISQNINAPVRISVPEEKPSPERKYSLRHIVMCLVSTAVCAIAAGIFAGLYFSVV